MTSFHAVVEFDSESTCQKATMRALRIFGVMMAGWKEYRPVFSTPAENRANITLQNIPYGTEVGELVDEVNEVLAAVGLRVNTSGMVPRGVLLTNGRLDLRFPSFVEAAHVAELLNDHVRGMASRRALPEDEKQLQQSFLTYKTGLEKAKKVADKEKKRQEAAELEEEEEEENEEENVAAELDEEDDDSDEDFDVGIDEEDEEDEEAEGDDEKKKAKKRPVWKVSETDHDYFQGLLEAEREFPEQPEQLRPFDVTWTPVPRARNKHMYL
ncbi:hypothetical protein BBJ28_00019080 [Nothophytophthora sp. Chile5]|nr:hypothetical protein BBJ28_00019080 [Nothophytophthora sp. Chile5]